MNLTSEQAFWEVSNGLIASYPSLEKDLRCDCVIIGGGITGALIGYHFAAAGIATVILDKRDIGMGSTSGSTGLLQYEIDVPLWQLTERIGAKGAKRAYQLCHETLHDLHALTNRLHIRCGYEKQPSLQIARYRKELPELAMEAKLRKALGIEVDLWTAADIHRRFSFQRPAGLFSEVAASVDPHRLTHGLLAHACHRGLQVYDRTTVTKIQRTRTGVIVKTQDGHTIKARRAVVAAGFESKEFLSASAGHLSSTYAIISEPIQGQGSWYRKSLIWETGSPYLYVRSLPDGRIIVGGEDEPFVNPTRRDELISYKTRVLLQKFKKLFPQINLQVAYSWAGTFGGSKDGLPYIGEQPPGSHVYYALGYGGNGITFSLIAAGIIRDAFLGRRNGDAKLFAFGR